ncbi:hypothetical protein FOZ63_032193 [Perkinsus olseni]|uniref:Uncharacterized protein n=1 Tax=Perkinsus olseni TaxID=32597 RepID=A0A7J6T995_PEROL|nr:hypothetical protein FOZ62_029188 [Perkinsus olseni]KAF4743804.1 hypothetical protein FOZ63_032193 [Perkinsus olseni]
MFQLPHHFQALRCKVIEGLWGGEQGREPMHDLIGDILEYCRRPELSLDCPNEVIVAGTCPSNYPMFMRNEVAYQVSSSGSRLRLVRICTSASRASWCVTTFGIPDRARPWKCHYDPDADVLYLLYVADGGVMYLQKHEMAIGRTGDPLSIPQLGLCGGSLVGMIVVGYSLYVAMRFESGFSASTTSIEVFVIRLRMNTAVGLVHTIHGQKNDPSFSFIRFNAVRGAPQAVHIVFKSANAWHSVRIDMVRSGSPMVFSTRRNELIDPPSPTGALLQNTPGLNMIMFEEPDGYVLRHPRDLRKLATIDKCYTFLPKDTPIVFGRWSFSVFKKRPNGVNTWIHFYPYLPLNI